MTAISEEIRTLMNAFTGQWWVRRKTKRDFIADMTME
jgi:hypothetical protein